MKFDSRTTFRGYNNQFYPHSLQRMKEKIMRLERIKTMEDLRKASDRDSKASKQK